MYTQSWGATWGISIHSNLWLAKCMRDPRRWRIAPTEITGKSLPRCLGIGVTRNESISDNLGIDL